MRNKLICSILAFALIGNVSLCYAIDTTKLLNMKPLPSERLTKLANDYENNKLWPSLVLGVLGAGIISNNLGQGLDSYRLSNALTGGVLLLTGGLIYFFPGEYETDRKVLAYLNLDQTQKETAVYYLLKDKAEKMKVQRAVGTYATGFMAVFSAALASNNSVSQMNKDSLYSIAGISLAVCLLNAFFPSQIEVDVAEMEKQL